MLWQCCYRAKSAISNVEKKEETKTKHKENIILEEILEEECKKSRRPKRWSYTLGLKGMRDKFVNEEKISVKLL